MKQFYAYEQIYPKLAKELKRRINCKLPVNLLEEHKKIIQKLQTKPVTISTRKASHNFL